MKTTPIRDTRREEIMEAARDLFSRKGYHGTSIPEIARAAGISTGLIYYIFPSKEDILLACSESVASLHLNIFERSHDIPDPLVRFDFIVRELYISLDKESKEIMVMYKDISTLQHETRQHILTLIKNLDNRFVELFEEGQRAGVFSLDIPNPRVFASNILGIGHMWALQKTWHFLPEVSLEAYIDAQLTYFHAQLLDNPDKNLSQRSP